MGDLSANFDRDEFECQCGCGMDTVDYKLVEVLEDVRSYFNSPITINSGCRCPEHNHNEGGSPNSQHLYSKAADFRVSEVSDAEVHRYLTGKYPDTFGIGRYYGRTHIDVRATKARWSMI